jgi:iron complex transport system permease protein
MRTPTIALTAAFGGLASVVLALGLGSVPIGAAEWWAALSGRGDPITMEILWSLRAPRALAAFAVGGLLALAGALLQALLRNPLADPYILGVSGGAGVGAMLAMVLTLGATMVSALALAGALGVASALLALSFTRGGWQPDRMLLAGVAIASGCGAITSLILALAPAAQLPGMLFWMMGDLSDAHDSRLAWLLLLACAAITTMLSPSLDVLILGTAKARSLGVAVTRIQVVALACATTSTVAAVLLAGSVGFVGLVVPHFLRLAGLHRHRLLLPLAAIIGGTLVTVADTLARTIARPLELPVGAITALVGVPVLFYLMARAAPTQ